MRDQALVDEVRKTVQTTAELKAYAEALDAYNKASSPWFRTLLTLDSLGKLLLASIVAGSAAFLFIWNFQKDALEIQAQHRQILTETNEALQTNVATLRAQSIELTARSVEATFRLRLSDLLRLSAGGNRLSSFYYEYGAFLVEAKASFDLAARLVAENVRDSTDIRLKGLFEFALAWAASSTWAVDDPYRVRLEAIAAEAFAEGVPDQNFWQVVTGAYPYRALDDHLAAADFDVWFGRIKAWGCNIVGGYLRQLLASSPAIIEAFPYEGLLDTIDDCLYDGLRPDGFPEVVAALPALFNQRLFDNDDILYLAYLVGYENPFAAAVLLADFRANLTIPDPDFDEELTGFGLELARQAGVADPAAIGVPAADTGPAGWIAFQEAHLADVQVIRTRPIQEWPRR